MLSIMSCHVGSCRHRVGTMSKLVGIWRAMAMSMSKRDVIKKLMSSGLAYQSPYGSGSPSVLFYEISGQEKCLFIIIVLFFAFLPLEKSFSESAMGF